MSDSVDNVDEDVVFIESIDKDATDVEVVALLIDGFDDEVVANGVGIVFVERLDDFNDIINVDVDAAVAAVVVFDVTADVVFVAISKFPPGEKVNEERMALACAGVESVANDRATQ
ncbi:hypothetical protein NDU88_006255 [Pleurodeles waltl]|uniref:Uncharacterized protein n=1 Tax=Pleurodeles waltl TaxID=8319 RepID=A0AAV7QKM6_PLEWA|nr:hypothetical protein NDU88_006255 [Pleurodeles waltl]